MKSNIVSDGQVITVVLHIRYVLIPENGIGSKTEFRAFSEKGSQDKRNETKDNCHSQSQ